MLFFFLEAGLKVETCSCFGSNLSHYQFVCICTLTKAVGRVVVSSICKPVDCFHLFLMWSLTPATTCRWNDWFKMPESEVERQEQLSLLHVLPIPSAGNNMKKKLVLARKNRLRLEGSRFRLQIGFISSCMKRATLCPLFSSSSLLPVVLTTVLICVTDHCWKQEIV